MADDSAASHEGGDGGGDMERLYRSIVLSHQIAERLRIDTRPLSDVVLEFVLVVETEHMPELVRRSNPIHRDARKSNLVAPPIVAVRRRFLQSQVSSAETLAGIEPPDKDLSAERDRPAFG